MVWFFVDSILHQVACEVKDLVVVVFRSFFLYSIFFLFLEPLSTVLGLGFFISYETNVKQCHITAFVCLAFDLMDSSYGQYGLTSRKLDRASFQQWAGPCLTYL